MDLVFGIPVIDSAVIFNLFEISSFAIEVKIVSTNSRRCSLWIKSTYSHNTAPSSGEPDSLMGASLALAVALSRAPHRLHTSFSRDRLTFQSIPCQQFSLGTFSQSDTN